MLNFFNWLGEIAERQAAVSMMASTCMPLQRTDWITIGPDETIHILAPGSVASLERTLPIGAALGSVTLSAEKLLKSALFFVQSLWICPVCLQ